MPITNILQKSPGLDALVADGPSITIVEQLIQAQVFSRGRSVVCAIGAVINDQGAPNVPTALDGRVLELSSTYGAFAEWLGDGQAAGQVGHASGYEGNLYARMKGGDVPVLVLVVPDLALKDKTITDNTAVDETITFTRSSGTNGNITIPAGTRISDGAATPFVVATLEDVTFDDGETGDKAVRVRAAVDLGVAYVAMNTLDTFVENGLTTSPEDTNITVKTASASGTAADTLDNAELIERYKYAIDRILNNVPGRSASIMVTDRDELEIADYLAAHCTSASGRGFQRICVVSPPKGTTTSVARGIPTDGVGRATLDRTRCVYTHPGVQRRFSDDADNLAADKVATLPGAMLCAMRISASQPWENPGENNTIGRQLFSNYGLVGEEDLGGSPGLKQHFQAGIMQLDSDVDENGRATFEYFDGITAYFPTGSVKPQTVDDRRMTDYVEKGLVAAAKPHHKALATPRNRDRAAAAMEAFLSRELSEKNPDDQHIAAFSPIVPQWNGALQVATFPVEVQLLGSMRNILIPLTIGTGVVTFGA